MDRARIASIIDACSANTDRPQGYAAHIVDAATGFQGGRDLDKYRGYREQWRDIYTRAGGRPVVSNLRGNGELERFKRDIDLAAYAASLEYVEDPAAGWTGSHGMGFESDDAKITISMNKTGTNLIYPDNRNSREGSINDFVQVEKSTVYGEVRRELRLWADVAGLGPAVLDWQIPTMPEDRRDLLQAWQKFRVLDDYSYFESRGLTQADLAAVGAEGKLKIDGSKNILFPHQDEHCLCGWEALSKLYNGFSAGGHRGLWLTGKGGDPAYIVICESAIDAVSYAKLHPEKAGTTVYASFAGTWNKKQPELIKAIFEYFPDAKIIAAVDSDEIGDKYAAALDAMAPGRVTQHSPDARGDNWNAVLMRREGLQSAPVQPETEAVPAAVNVHSSVPVKRPRPARFSSPGL